MIAERLRTYQPSLRARATTWYVGLLAVALLVFSIGIYVGVRAYLKQSLQRAIAGTANTIATDLLGKLPEKGEAWVLGEVRESYANTPIDRYVRLSATNRVLYQTSDMRQPDIRLNELALPQHSEVGAFHRQRADGQQVLIYSLPFHTSDGRLFEVEAGTSLFVMDATLRSLLRILFAATVAILACATVGGYLLMKQPLRPLVTLTEKAAAIGKNQLGVRLPVVPTGDELERLTHSLNGMIERMEDALAHNYRFSADASHELRTPLTIMRGELEEMLRIDELPPAAVDNLVSTLEEIDRMSRIVNSLMAITRLDAGGERMDLIPVDFSSLVRTTAEHMRLLAYEKGLPLECACLPEIYVHADPLRLKQVIVNLVDNAIKYTPAAGNPLEGADLEAYAEGRASLGREQSLRQGVRISVIAKGGSAQLQIADHGIGIGSDVLPYVFDRFYRADFARSRGAGGVGLGLAIVKSIVTAHEGSVSITSTVDQGSVVTVLLPLVKAPEQTVMGRSLDAMTRKQTFLEHA